MGNVGDDPRVNEINETTKVARFPLATNEVHIDREGNPVQKTEWHNVVFWHKATEIIEAYVRKGIPLYIEGKIQSYLGRQGRYQRLLLRNQWRQLCLHRRSKRKSKGGRPVTYKIPV